MKGRVKQKIDLAIVIMVQISDQNFALFVN